ncbi:MAG: tol-pal system protein YbgF [Rhodospirillales bacterium]|nr:tol-pal system protein YbgF [Rhodospirillales bacterium]
MSRLSMCLCLFVCVTAISLASQPTGALAQEQNLQPLFDRLERLERDIRTLNIQIARGGTPAPLASGSEEAVPQAAEIPAIARLGARMDNLEADLRLSTGTLERANYQINQILERLDKLVADVDFRLTALETNGGQGAGAGQPGSPLSTNGTAPPPAAVQSVAPTSGARSLGTVPVSEVARIAGTGAAGADQPSAPAESAAIPALPDGVLPAGTVNEQYTYAFNLLRQTNYAQAESALSAFISAHSDDPLASNARYWLGQTYFIRKAYQEAAQVFFEGYNKDPKGPKAPDSLLKLGMSLASLGKTEEACAAFGKVLTDFPKVAATIKNAGVERKRNSCP